MKILLVEDNPLTAKGLVYLLEREKYLLNVASSLKTARDLLNSHHYDLILLDISLPDGDGFTLAETLRRDQPDLPIIFLTAKDDENDIVRGLELGAEDYITKPFRTRELLLRIRKILRHGTQYASTLICGKLSFQLDTDQVKVGDRVITLSPLERRLLLCLLENPGRIVTRERLLDEIWDASGRIVNDNTLTVYMKRLRNKLNLPGAIVTFCVVLAASLALVTAFGALRTSYQAAANRELAGIIGAALTNNSNDSSAELDPLRVIQELRSPSSAMVARGEAALRQYGYLSSDLASPSASNFVTQVLATALLIILASGLVLLLYFWWLDYRTSRKIRRLVQYLQDLGNKIYDLRLAENQEGEFSLLTNELYKITVALREAADQNRLARQELETALADISHQLRTPLTSLQIMVDNIYDDPEMPAATRQEFLRTISRQTEAMSSLVTTLLNLAKFDSKSIKLHRTKFPIAALLSEVQQNLAVLADIAEVKLEISGDLTTEVSLDLRWQSEALTNIVKNCIEHSPIGSVVEIAVKQNPLFLRLIISDHGEGISPQDLHHIFERFYKSQNAKSSSIGIGLSLAKAIIESDQGQIAVRSVEGQGTTFTVTYYS